MKSIDDFTITAASAFSGNSKIPRALSYPVLGEIDGDIYVCYFVYVCSQQGRDTGYYARPDGWCALDISDGTLKHKYHCWERDFSSASYGVNYFVGENKPSNSAVTHKCHTSMRKLFGEVVEGISNTGTLNEKIYSEYLDNLLTITPKDYQQFYLDLSI